MYQSDERVSNLKKVDDLEKKCQLYEQEIDELRNECQQLEIAGRQVLTQ